MMNLSELAIMGEEEEDEEEEEEGVVRMAMLLGMMDVH